MHRAFLPVGACTKRCPGNNRITKVDRPEPEKYNTIT